MESNSNTPPIKSFTSRKPPITFDVDGEQFVAYQVLPAETFGRFAEKVLMLQRAGSDYEGPDKLDLTLSETVTVLLDAVELGLAADSAQRVATRLSDLDNPIDVSTLSEVLLWLLEQYGMSGKDADSAVDSDRPTPPTSD